ncbi:phosphotransferase [Enterococcus lemanii]|uniref:Phosphotransferase n=1 Tax=Enterococcus lemanii TaxID=1159752 RepID=A0ABV9MRL5_9ENTE|nr:phosphotransferase [Enterococcus lemanii]MBM7710322.1 CTP:phosphocholine cytidylyltransferase-like protein/thiamine kinase-like enzyme [Enterococcus lemanii]
MNIYDYDVLKQLATENYSNQRILSEQTGYSLGKVNEAFRQLVDHDYIFVDGSLTTLGQAKIQCNRPKNAVILAAGFGMRMVPINTEMPKGLLEVQGEILIERLIRQLQEAGIKDITIVVGFLKEKFEYLIDQFGVTLIYNKEYATKNNLHSLALQANQLENTYILPSDIWLEENPFSTTELYSWYLVSEETDASSTIRVNRQKELLETKNNQIGNKMIGVAYVTKNVGKSLAEQLLKMDGQTKYAEDFWEVAFFHEKQAATIYAKVYRLDQAFEIDTYEQLRELDDQSTHLQTEIIDLIAKELSVETKEIVEIQVLKKGMTNRSFLFRVNEKRYIMRIPGEGTDELINRQQEAQVYNVLANHRISDDIVYISPEKGYKITEYLENSNVCDPENLNEVALCMAKLRSFHQLQLQVPHTFDLFEKIDFYESLWEGQPSIFKDYATTKEKIYALKTLVEQLPKEWCLTHIDAVPDNFLFTETGEIRLIDWEYAGMQDPHLDVAMFAIYSLYEREQVEQLIDAYFVEGCSSEVRMKIYAYIAISGLLWSNWCEYKRLLGVEFGEYSLRQYRYAKEYAAIVQKMINSQEFV